MAKRLAITISGAVSLGSYEAGVLYEVTRAIGQHNADPQTVANGDFIHIDVLTGASAGGMTATIAAQKLMFSADALSGVYTNAFYLPWVADVSIDGLLAMHGDDDPKKSVLSSEHVIDISKRYLTNRYQSHLDPPRKQHPAAAQRIWLGLALSNLNGVDYGLSLRPTGKFIYTRHQDQLTTWLDAANAQEDDTFALWDPLRNAAVSCGAFAFAFRVIDVIRHASEYPDPSRESAIGATQTFSYTDGGTFQNEPIGLAKNLVDKLDNHLDVENRFYLFVSPGAKSSTANSQFNAHVADYRETAVRLVSSIFDQARFQDWVMAEKTNSQVATYNAQAAALYGELRQGRLNAAALQPAATALLPLLFQQNTKETQAQAWARVQQQFRADYTDLLNNNGKPTADTFIDSILTFETAAQLGERDEMTIYGITADEGELASSELFAFAGFFDRRYRDHDYEVGRRKTQAFLANPGALGPIRHTPEPLGLIDPALNGLTLEKMDRGVREKVRDRLRDRAHDILKEAGVNPWLVGGAVREAIDVALIKPQLDKLLKL
jgi:hypothetical protein